METIRFPLLSPKRDGDSLSESINLKSSASYSTDDAGVVDNLNFNA